MSVLHEGEPESEVDLGVEALGDTDAEDDIAEGTLREVERHEDEGGEAGVAEVGHIEAQPARAPSVKASTEPLERQDEADRRGEEEVEEQVRPSCQL